VTNDEREQLAALTATVKNEFEHITKRLDSHSQDIRDLGSNVHSLESKIDAHCAVEAANAPAKIENRKGVWSLLVVLASGIVAYVSGWFASHH